MATAPILAISDPSLTSTLLRVAVVFVLLIATMRVMTRLTGRRNRGRGRARAVPRRRGDARPIEVIDRQGLSRNATVAIVEIEGRRLALGITDQNVRLLADLTDGDERPVEIDLRDAPDGQRATAPSLRALADSLRERPAR
jgi:flagellar biogenesis protein FliO